jgi:ubiquinone/menaquinone biosynthesis C-methylase UbiE
MALELQDRMTVPPGLSKEQELLLLAARPGQDPAVQSRIRELLSADLDWADLVRTALEHRLVPLLDACLQPLGEAHVPGDILHALSVRSRRNREQNRLTVQAVAEIAAEMRVHGLSALFLHGPALAVAVFGDPDLQEAVNPVVLLRMQDLPRFGELMAARGYRQRQECDILEPLQHWGDCAPAAIYSRNEAGVVIEAYTSLASRTLAIDLDYDACRARANDIDIGGVPVSTLSPEDLLLALCLTGGSREWRLFETYCALAGLLQRNPGMDLDRVRERARQMGAGRVLALGLALVQQTLGPAILPQENGAAWLRRELENCRRRLLMDPGNEPAAPGFSLSRMRLHDRTRDRYRYALGTLFTPRRAGLARRDTGQKPSANAAKAINKTHWGRRSESWERWSEKTERQSAETSRLLMEAAGVAPGQRVLDIACGVGDTSLELGTAVGPAGFVMTTDLAFDMISKARRRATDRSLTNLHYCTMAMESLPFRDRLFDGIVCRLGIMYCARVERALKESRRVLRPGGRAAWLVCGPREENTLLRIVHEVVTDLFELEQQGDEGVISPFRFSAEGSLAEYVKGAGFDEVTELELVKELLPPSGYRFWQAGVERGLGIPLDLLPANTLAQLDERMTAAFEPYRQGDRYQLTSLSWIVVGTAPG